MSNRPSDFNDMAVKPQGKKKIVQLFEAILDGNKELAYGSFIVKAAGVYSQSAARKGDDTPPAPMLLCSPLWPLALGRSVAGDGYALLLAMKNPDGNQRQFLIRLADTQIGGGEIVRTAFCSLGGTFGAGIRSKPLFIDLLNCFVQYGKRTLPRLVLADKSGWHQTGKRYAFLCPWGETIGDTPTDRLVHVSLPDITAHAPAGSMENLQNQVYRHAATNSRLMLVLCVALASPLVDVLQIEPFMVHIFGTSGDGKSSLLRAALSVWGSTDLWFKTWSMTNNGLGGLLTQRNDSFLALDELGLNQDETGNAAYIISGKQDKTRLNKGSELMDVRSFRVVCLSNGEHAFGDFLSQTKRRRSAGMEVRAIDIPSDAGAGLGVWEDTGGISPAELSEQVKSASEGNHGHAARLYLSCLVADRNDRPDWLRELLDGVMQVFFRAYLPNGADGQVRRVCRHFAVLAAVGELSIQYGVLPVGTGVAIEQIGKCFVAWLDRRGTPGKLEVQQLLDQVEAFFHAYGPSRFEPLDGEYKAARHPVTNRVGYSRQVVSEPSKQVTNEYFVLPGGLKEIIAGYDQRWALATLEATGIIRGAAAKRSVSVYLSGVGQVRAYHFYPASELC